MARPELRARHHSVYTKSEKQMEIWKNLCPSNMTLNAWIVEMVEKAIENRPQRTINPLELDTLRLENDNLRRELKFAMSRIELLEKKEANYTKIIKEVDGREKEIINIIKRSKYVTASGLLRATTYFGMFDTTEETEAFLSEQRRRIKHALEVLEYAGLIDPRQGDTNGREAS